jgi:hypothetical protein
MSLGVAGLLDVAVLCHSFSLVKGGRLVDIAIINFAPGCHGIRALSKVISSSDGQNVLENHVTSQVAPLLSAANFPQIPGENLVVLEYISLLLVFVCVYCSSIVLNVPSKVKVVFFSLLFTPKNRERS